jgi:hypothetical protein
MAFRSLPSAEYLRECFDLNEETGELTWKAKPLSHFKNSNSQRRHTACWVGKKAGNIDKDGYLIVELAWYGKRQRIRVHRIVWKLVTGEDYTGELDHKNNCKTDNRFNNLRKATKNLNMSNTTRVLGNMLYRGVRKRNDASYRAQIVADKVPIYVGSYTSPEAAHSAYCLAALHFKKEFANFGPNSCFKDFPLTSEFVSKVRHFINKAEEKMRSNNE